MNNLSFVVYSGHKVYLHIIVVITVYYSIMQYSIVHFVSCSGIFIWLQKFNIIEMKYRIRSKSASLENKDVCRVPALFVASVAL